MPKNIIVVIKNDNQVVQISADLIFIYTNPFKVRKVPSFWD